jgi:hypothetical protein
MGLIISSTETKKIFVKGTPIELETIYGRVEFSSRLNGKTIEIGMASFYDKPGYVANNFLNTDLPEQTITVEIQANEEQNVETALAYMALFLGQQGYVVEIEASNEIVEQL